MTICYTKTLASISFVTETCESQHECRERCVCGAFRMLDAFLAQPVTKALYEYVYNYTCDGHAVRVYIHVTNVLVHVCGTDVRHALAFPRDLTEDNLYLNTKYVFPRIHPNLSKIPLPAEKKGRCLTKLQKLAAILFLPPLFYSKVPGQEVGTWPER